MRPSSDVFYHSEEERVRAVEERDKREKIEREQRAEEESRIKSLSKPLHELVVERVFDVQYVLGQSYPHTDDSLHTSGFSSSLVLEVTPRMNNHIATRKLIFEGNTPAIKGSIIKAKIPMYDEHKIQDGIDGFSMNAWDFGPRKIINPYYLSRPEFKEQESAIEITLVDVYGNHLRSDRSVDYGKYQKD